MHLQHIRSDERFSVRQGWLDSKWHFSFGHYYDPQNVSFGALRVFNDDLIAAAAGFESHPHEEMEIVTIVLAGQLEHRDSTGGRLLLSAGDVQRMTAGTGISHSERNPLTNEATRLLQLWFLPDTPGLPPSYEQKRFDAAGRKGRFQRIITKHPTDGELAIHQDADLFLTTLHPGEQLRFVSAPGRRQYLYVIRGSASVDGAVLERGDQGRITFADEGLDLSSAQGTTANLLLIDLA